jgi:hypothetical protein
MYWRTPEGEDRGDGDACGASSEDFAASSRLEVTRGNFDLLPLGCSSLSHLPGALAPPPRPTA